MSSSETAGHAEATLGRLEDLPAPYRAELGAHVGADPNLSHRADRILSQGWKPTLRGSAVDKFSS